MDVSRKTTSRLTQVVLLLAALFLWGNLIWFAKEVYPVSPWLNSDSAAELLYARYMSQTGRLLPGTWYFTTEVRLLHNSLIQAPLFWLTSDFATVHILAVTIICALLYGAGVLFFHCMGLERPVVLLGGLLFLIPVSVDTFDYYQNSLYYSFFLLSLILLWSGIAWSMTPGRRAKSRWICFTACGVFSFVMGLCGIRYLEIMFFPLGLAAGLRVLRRGLLRRESWKGQWPYFSLALSGLAGYLVMSVAQKFGRFPSGTISQITIAPPASWPARLVEALQAYWGSLRHAGPSDELFWLILLASWAWLWWARRDLPSRQSNFLNFVVLSNAVNVIVLVLVDFGFPIQYRYTLLPCTLAWLAIPMAVQSLFARGKTSCRAGMPMRASWPRRAAVALSASLLLCGLMDVDQTLYRMPRIDAWARARVETAEQLQEKEYSFGYGTYWNASIITYVSNGEVSVAPVGIDEKTGGTGPFPIGCPHDYFQDIPGREKKFLLLSADEVPVYGKFFGDPILQNDYYTAYDYPFTLLTQ